MLCCWEDLPRSTIIWKQACVKHKSVSNTNNHCVPIGMTAGEGKFLSILDFLEQVLNRLIGFILRIESYVVILCLTILAHAKDFIALLDQMRGSSHTLV
jgi:hypothetical protein